VQAVQRRVGSSSPNTSCKVLPLSSMYSFSIDVVNLAAHNANLFVGKVGERKIVEEVYPIERMFLLHVRRVHGCKGARDGGGLDALNVAGLHRGRREVEQFM